MGSRVPTHKPSRHNPWDSAGPAPGVTHVLNFSCRTLSDSLGLALGGLTDKAPNPAVPLSHIDLFILPNPFLSVDFLSQHLQSHRKWFWLKFVRVKPSEENVLTTETVKKNPFISHGFIAEMRSCSVAYLYWFTVMFNYLSNKQIDK